MKTIWNIFAVSNQGWSLDHTWSRCIILLVKLTFPSYFYHWDNAFSFKGWSIDYPWPRCIILMVKLTFPSYFYYWDNAVSFKGWSFDHPWPYIIYQLLKHFLPCTGGRTGSALLHWGNPCKVFNVKMWRMPQDDKNCNATAGCWSRGRGCRTQACCRLKTCTKWNTG